ncbi:MAG: hypothetical protein NT040_01880 [Bacteroidetes bacterium]|nr:hypothetical protein [Bacteroidota bacterium]
MKTYLFILVLSVLPFFANAQDTIVLTTGVKIPCKVTKVDSLFVYYDLTGKKNVRHTSVGSNYVQVVHYYDQVPGGTSPAGSSTRKHRNCVAFSGGVSLATGIFASDDLSSEEAGFAGDGLNVNLTLSHQFEPFFGITIKALYNSNKFKTEKIEDYYSSIFSSSVTANDVKYQTIGGLAGPVFTIPVDVLSIKGGVLIGYEYLGIPETTYMISNGTQSGWIKVGKRGGGAFIFDVTAGLAFSINANWEFFVNADYLFGNYKIGGYPCSFGDGSVIDFSGYKQKYGVFNIAAGLGLKF